MQAEVVAANKQLEKSKLIVEFISSKVETLNKQAEAARKNKVILDMVMYETFGG